MPRRKPRQLNQKVRIETAEQTAARAFQTEETLPAAPAEALPSVADNLSEPEEGEDRESSSMPRRSRRSPRHLRVSGQRRRRYRDERYPNQSPMPLTFAAASPEMASGKVWISYPVAQITDEHAEPEQSVVPEYGHEETAAAVASASESTTPIEAQQREAQPVHIAEPQPENKPDVTLVNAEETDAIEVPVNEEPSVISAADEAVAEATLQQALPAEKAETKPEGDAFIDAVEDIVEEAKQAEEQPLAENASQQAAINASDVSEETKQQVEEVLSAPEVTAEPVTTTEPHAPVPARDEPVAAPAAIEQVPASVPAAPASASAPAAVPAAPASASAPAAVPAAPASASAPAAAPASASTPAAVPAVPASASAPAAVPAAPAPAPASAPAAAITSVEPAYKHHATAPMTKAPAPAYQPEPARSSDWVRPAFNFEGKGAAGGHAASHQATAPATRP